MDMNAREHGEVLGETGPYAALTRSVIHAGIEVQKRLGPWLLESAYEACLAYELERSGHTVERQVLVSLRYRDLIVPNAFRMDLLIDGILVVELKVTEAITKEHEAQVLSYLRFSEKPAGLLMNFALQPLAKRGVRRFLMTHSSSVMNEGGPPDRFAASTSPLVLSHVVSGPSPDTTSASSV